MSPGNNSHPPGPGYAATLTAISIGQILSWAALYYAFSSFVLPMMRELDWSKPTVMGAFTLGLAAWGGATYGIGAAIDRGHGRTVLTLGSLLAGVGFLGWSMIQAPWMLYAVWALLGATMAATLYEPAFAIVTRRYPERYRDAITAITLVGGFASTLSFPACEWLIAAFGWRQALQVIGAVLLVVVVPLHAWALRGPAVVAPAMQPDARADQTLHEALRERAFWLLALCFTFYAFASAALWAHVIPAFESKGWTSGQAQTVLIWIGPAQVLGRLVYAAMLRGASLRLVGMVVMLGLPISLVLFALASRTWALLLFALLFGLANGLVTLVRGGLVPEYFGRAHIGRIGGAMSSLGLLARAAAPLAAAWMLLVLAGYREVMLAMAVLGLAAAVAFALAKPPQR